MALCVPFSFGEMAAAYESGLFSDWTVVLGDKKWPVHRIILSQHSEFFKAQCKSEWCPPESDLSNLLPPPLWSHFSALLRWVYAKRGESASLDDPVAGLAFADILQINDLHSESLEKIHKNWHTRQGLQYLATLDELGSRSFGSHETLRSSLVKKMAARLKDFIGHYGVLGESTFEELLKSPALEVLHEDDVFDMLWSFYAHHLPQEEAGQGAPKKRARRPRESTEGMWFTCCHLPFVSAPHLERLFHRFSSYQESQEVVRCASVYSLALHTSSICLLPAPILNKLRDAQIATVPRLLAVDFERDDEVRILFPVGLACAEEQGATSKEKIVNGCALQLDVTWEGNSQGPDRRPDTRRLLVSLRVRLADGRAAPRKAEVCIRVERLGVQRLAVAVRTKKTLLGGEGDLQAHGRITYTVSNFMQHGKGGRFAPKLTDLLAPQHGNFVLIRSTLAQQLDGYWADYFCTEAAF